MRCGEEVGRFRSVEASFCFLSLSSPLLFHIALPLSKLSPPFLFFFFPLYQSPWARRARERVPSVSNDQLLSASERARGGGGGAGGACCSHLVLLRRRRRRRRSSLSLDGPPTTSKRLPSPPRLSLFLALARSFERVLRDLSTSSMSSARRGGFLFPRRREAGGPMGLEQPPLLLSCLLDLELGESRRSVQAASLLAVPPVLTGAVGFTRGSRAKEKSRKLHRAGRIRPRKNGESRSMDEEPPPLPPSLIASKSPCSSLSRSSSRSRRHQFPPSQYHAPKNTKQLNLKSIQVSATTRRTPCAGAAAGPPSTSRSRRARRAATRPRASASVSLYYLIARGRRWCQRAQGAEVEKEGQRREREKGEHTKFSSGAIGVAKLFSSYSSTPTPPPSTLQKKKQTTGPTRPSAARPRARAACATSRTSRAAPRTASARAPRPRRRRHEKRERESERMK